MERYNYEEEILKDVIQYIKYQYDVEELKDKLEDEDEFYEELYDELWGDDSVTGNASGSYTFNTWKAEEYICHNLDLLGEACEEFCCNFDVLKNGAEACDVTIRCHLLGQSITKAIEQIKEELSDVEDI